jgi:elongation factor P
MVSINTETELPLSVDMPPSVVLEVTYAELEGIQLQMQPNQQLLKPVLLQGVPLFINEGDKIKIDTASGSYMERVKE